MPDQNLDQSHDEEQPQEPNSHIGLPPGLKVVDFREDVMKSEAGRIVLQEVIEKLNAAVTYAEGLGFSRYQAIQAVSLWAMTKAQEVLFGSTPLLHQVFVTVVREAPANDEGEKDAE